MEDFSREVMVAITEFYEDEEHYSEGYSGVIRTYLRAGGLSLDKWTMLTFS